MGKNSSRNFALFVQLKKKKYFIKLLQCPQHCAVIVVEPEEIQSVLLLLFSA